MSTKRASKKKAEPKAKKRGRQPILTRTKLREILNNKKLLNLTNVQVAKKYGIGVNTIYNTVNRYKEAEKKARKSSGKKAVALSKKQAPAATEVTQ